LAEPVELTGLAELEPNIALAEVSQGFAQNLVVESA
jgi:hypothetical protein